MNLLILKIVSILKTGYIIIVYKTSFEDSIVYLSESTVGYLARKGLVSKPESKSLFTVDRIRLAFYFDKFYWSYMT